MKQDAITASVSLLFRDDEFKLAHLEVVTASFFYVAGFTVNDGDDKTFTVEQIICDPEGFNEWRLTGVVDLQQSREVGEAITKLTNITAL